jgi:hypothetical protein
VQGSRLVRDDAKNAEAQAACRTLAQEFTEQRFPTPRMLSFKVNNLGPKLVSSIYWIGIHVEEYLTTCFS